MQPYVFPYIGYFHLIDASETIVFYDDVNFIKRGWINRNRILINGSDFLFTIPVAKASQNKLINETIAAFDSDAKNKLYSQIEGAYKKAPNFTVVFEMIQNVFNQHYHNIADMAIFSIVSVYNYLGVEINWLKSSECSPNTKSMEKADRLIEITKELGFGEYVNLIGGKDLYEKDYFKTKGIDLSFVQSGKVEYTQFKNDFIPGLSIIDVLMFCEKEDVKRFLKSYLIV